MLAYLFIILAVVVRLLPHPWHLTPLGAALVFFGAKRPTREWVAPLLLLASADVYLTTVHYRMHVGADHLVLAGTLKGPVIVRRDVFDNRERIGS